MVGSLAALGKALVDTVSPLLITLPIWLIMVPLLTSQHRKSSAREGRPAHQREKGALS